MGDGPFDVEGLRRVLCTIKVEDISDDTPEPSIMADPRLKPDVQTLLTAWVDNVRKNPGKLPTVNSYDPLDYPQLVPNFIHLTGGPDTDQLRIKFNGSLVFDLVDRDLIGQRLMNVYDPKDWGFVRELYQDGIEKQYSMVIQANLLIRNRDHVEVQTLILPYTNIVDGDVVTDLLGVAISSRR